jgi:hypothetical protein
LYIRFQFDTNRKVVHALVHTEVGKDGLDKAQATVATAYGIAREEGGEVRLPTHSRLKQGETQKVSSLENACFAFNRLCDFGL